MFKESYTSELTPEQVKEANARMLDILQDPNASDADMRKVAAAAGDVIRLRVREGSFSRNILTPQTVGAADLYPSTTDDDPMYVGEIEPETPGGIVAPLGAQTKAYYFSTRRYSARFSRVMTRRYRKDVAQLLTYQMDLRSVLSDMSLKDLLYLEDANFLQTANSMLAPAAAAAGTTLLPGETVPLTGVVQWREIDAGVTPISVNDALAVMNESNFGLETATVLVNLNFAKQLQKWDRLDFGGDLAQEVKMKGFTEREFLGARWLFTNKNDLVGNGTMYMFGPQNFIGKTLILEDTTMHVKKEAFMLEWFAYEQLAQIFGHIAAVCRVDFTGVV